MWFWLIGSIFLIILVVRIRYQRQSGVCHSKRRLDGKTAIVTGSSAGIGRETALDLASRGARVILACRNVQKAQKVADDIIASTGNGQVIVRQVDTSNLTSVRNFAKEIIDTEKALHILVNNAGMLGTTERNVTSDGLELTMATNHFGHFLLTNMLLDLLKSSGPSRVVNVSSEGHSFSTSMDMDDLNYERKQYPGAMEAYYQTKLSNNLFTLELADKLRGTGVTTNCLHPGLVNTEIFWKDATSIPGYIMGVSFSLMGKDEKLGSQTSIYLAVSEDVENISGEYFSDCKIAQASKMAKDRGLAKKLWEVSERLVKLTSEDISYTRKQKE